MEGRHAELLEEAVAVEARAHRALLDGRPAVARDDLREAAHLYRASWELAPPASHGRLIGLLKAAVLAGDGPQEAAWVRERVPGDLVSPPASYARALAALLVGDDAAAAAETDRMRAGSAAFGRTADAIEALTLRDASTYATALAAIVADFEARPSHLTGVPIADTALMLERLAEPRGLAVRPASAVLPPVAT